MMRLGVFLAFLASALAQRELSDLYKAYQASGFTKNAPTVPTREMKFASAADDSNLFAPPHPGQSPVDYHPQRKELLKSDEPIIYYSWHIHVYFFHEDQNVTDRTLALRDRFIKTFSLATCDDDCFMGGPFDTCTQGMCVWDPYYGVDGPHPYGQWGVYLPNEMLGRTIAWMSHNHGEFEVLFHPNTGYMVGDHDPNKRALWIKQQVPLDLDFLVWLQCEWFGCSDQVTVEQVSI